jgi:hypothetical protein
MKEGGEYCSSTSTSPIQHHRLSVSRNCCRHRVVLHAKWHRDASGCQWLAKVWDAEKHSVLQQPNDVERTSDSSKPSSFPSQQIHPPEQSAELPPQLVLNFNLSQYHQPCLSSTRPHLSSAQQLFVRNPASSPQLLFIATLSKMLLRQ